MLSINQLTTYRWSFEDDLYFAKRAGFDAIGIWRRKLADFGEERAAELLHDSRMRVACLGWAGGFTGADGRSLDESIRDGLLAIRQAEMLQAGCLLVYLGGRNQHINSHLQRLVQQALDELLVMAEVAGVTLALKPLHPECAAEWTFQTDLEQTLQLVQQYNTPHLKLVYDSYQFPELHRSPRLVAELLPHLALVQLADARLPHSMDQERCPLGEGYLNLDATIHMLQEAGYRGAWDVELMGGAIEMSDYQLLLQQTVELLSEQVGAAAPIRRRLPSSAKLPLSVDIS